MPYGLCQGSWFSALLRSLKRPGHPKEVGSGDYSVGIWLVRSVTSTCAAPFDLHRVLEHPEFGLGLPCDRVAGATS